MPQQLSFLDSLLPETRIWERLDPESRNLLIETFARLIAKAVSTNNLTQEQTDDRYS